MIATSKNYIKKPAESLMHKTGWSAVSSLSIAVSSAITGIITARILGPNGVGHLVYLIWITEMTAVLCGVGMQNTLTRFLAELTGQTFIDQAAALQRWIFPRFLSITVVGVIVIVSLGFTSKSPYESVAIWISLPILFFLRGIGSLYQAFLAGQQRFDIAARINIVSSTVQLVGVILGSYYFGLFGAILGYAAAAVVPALMSVTMLYRLDSSVPIDNTLRRRIWSYAIDTWFALIVSTIVWSRIEIFFIQRYWNSQTVAMFSISLSLGILATQGPMMLTGAVMPHLAEQVGAVNKEAIQRIYSSGTRLMGLALFPICFTCAAMVPVLIPSLYGKDFAPAIPTAQLVIATSALSFATVGSSVVMALGKSRFIALSGIAGAIASLFGCLFLIPPLGAWGAAVSRFIVQCSMIALGVWYIHCSLRVRVPFRALACTFISAVLCAWTVHLAVTFWGGLESIIVATPVAVVVYLTFVRFFRVIDVEDERFFLVVLSRLPTSIQNMAFSMLGLTVRRCTTE